MGNFVTGNVALPPYKIDATPPQGNPAELDAGDINFLRDAVGDLRDHTTGWVNVKSSAYGAKGDGATDDTAAIVAAYNATATSGAAIYFPAGTYKFNLTILRSGVRIYGAGRARVADTSPLGGTIFIPADLTKPIIQIGDGTAQVEKVTIEHFSMKGDGAFNAAGTATSDGLVLDGTYNARIADFEIGHIGGRGIFITSSAARSSAYNHFVNGELINNSRYSLYVQYGASFTTATYLSHVNFSPAQVGSGDYGVYLEGAQVYLSNCWVQALNGHAHVYLLKDAGGHAPNLQLSNTFVDTGGNLTWIAVDINIGGAHGLVPTYISGGSFGIDGQVRWDDTTVVPRADPFIAPQANRFVEAKIHQKLYFDIWQGSGGTEFNDSNTPPLLLQGVERTTGGTTPVLAFSGGHFRTPGTFGQAWQIGTAAAVWRNATTTRLHYRPDFGYPGNDIDGAPFTPLQKSLAYSASMTPVADQGSWFVATATNATAFTINAPTINAVATGNFSGSRITITIKNTSGGALGVATFAAAYKMAAWTQPATGFQRSIDFLYDGTNWIEVSRTPADVPN